MCYDTIVSLNPSEIIYIGLKHCMCVKVKRKFRKRSNISDQRSKRSRMQRTSGCKKIEGEEEIVEEER